MKRLFPMILLLLLLTGCGTGNDYLSIRPHVEQSPQVSSPTESDPIPIVSNRLELRGAILSFIDNWKEQGTVLIRDYEGDVAQNLSEVMEYATYRHPTGAYAVDYADAEILEENGQQSVQVSFVFRRSITEINSIVLVDNNAAAYDKIKEALNSYSTSLTLRIRRYKEHDFAKDIVDYCMNHPQSILTIPQYSLKLYPEEGDHRILELHFTYPESKSTMREMQQELETTFHSVITYSQSGSTSLDKVKRLCYYLIRRPNQTLMDEAPPFPVYSLLAENKGHDLSFAMCFRDLCGSLGIQAHIVEGSKNGQTYYWNLLELEDTAFFVDLRRYVEQGEKTMTPLYDEDLLLEGYFWDQSIYSAISPESDTPTETDEETDVSPSAPTEYHPDKTEASTSDEETSTPSESASATETTEISAPDESTTSPDASSG